MQESNTVVSILQAAERIRRRCQEILEPWGLTLQQFRVLRILREAGEAGLPTLEVGYRMMEKTPGITRLLDRLEEKGLARRERCQDDRRRVLCRASKAALDLLAELDQPMTEIDRLLMVRLSPTEQTKLASFVDRIGP